MSNLDDVLSMCNLFTEKCKKGRKKVENGQNESILTSVWVRAAPESWVKYTTPTNTLVAQAVNWFCLVGLAILPVSDFSQRIKDNKVFQ